MLISKKMKPSVLWGSITLCLGGVLQTTSASPAVDSDGDGIPDYVDVCTYDAVGKKLGRDYMGVVIINDKAFPNGSPGCIFGDRDGDSIPDKYDTCPDRGGNGLDGLGIMFGGCPVTDNDGDGIPGSMDSCADQTVPASGEYWLAHDGCLQLDWVGQGLSDPDNDHMPSSDPAGNIVDICTYTGNKFGFGITNEGCPIGDVDHDGMPGVAAQEDACGSAGPHWNFGMTADGCPITDRDLDKVPNTQDYCPDTAGSILNGGCPEN